MRSRRVIEGIAGGLLTLWLVGGTGALWSWAAEVKAVSPAATGVGAGDTGAAASTASRSRAVAKPDPFRPFIETDMEQKIRQEEGLGKKKVERSLPLSPLQQREIGEFRLVGIAGNDDRRTAVVEDGTAKKTYSLFVGTYIGRNEGRVIQILPDRVIVEERVEDPVKKEKTAQTRRMTMMLHKGE
jgi:Tfp pilus assembly protein PilP